MNRWWVLLPALGVAAVLVSTDDAPSSSQGGSLSLATERVAPSARNPMPQGAGRASAHSQQRADKKVAEPIRTLVPRALLYGRTGVASTGQPGLFASRSWAEPTPPVVDKGPAVEEAPPFPYTVAGRQKEGKAWQVFLTRDSEAFVVREGDSLERDYKVAKIGDTSMTVVFTRLNRAHEVALGEMD